MMMGWEGSVHKGQGCEIEVNEMVMNTVGWWISACNENGGGDGEW